MSSFEKALQLQMTRRQLGERGLRLFQAAAGWQVHHSSFQPGQEIIGPQYQKIKNTIFIDLVPSISEDFVITHESALTGQQLVNELVGMDLFYNPPAYFLFNGIYSKFEDHGYNIVRTHKSVLHGYGYDTEEPNMLAIQNAYTPESVIRNQTDRLGNMGITVETKADYFIPKLADKDEKAVNISFQLGKLKVIYAQKKYQYTTDNQVCKAVYDSYMANIQTSKLSDGTTYDIIRNPSGSKDGSEDYRSIAVEEYSQQQQAAREAAFMEGIRAEEVATSEPIIVGAGAGEYAEENMIELFKLVDHFPKKLFVAAAGNYNDDWRAVREKLKDRWPQNLLLVGQWNREKNSPDGISGQINSADIYVDAADFGMPESRIFSSNATAIVSAIANILFAQGKSMEEVRETLIRSCKLTKYNLTDENLKLHDFANIEALAKHKATLPLPSEIARVLDKKAIDEVISSLGQAS